ncbi:MAG: hypothetical protein H0U70_08560 [Tatlockia sp.]|nr:hypothetical protein [Tatlockia sp.]
MPNSTTQMLAILNVATHSAKDEVDTAAVSLAESPKDDVAPNDFMTNLIEMCLAPTKDKPKLTPNS